MLSVRQVISKGHLSLHTILIFFGTQNGLVLSCLSGLEEIIFLNISAIWLFYREFGNIILENDIGMCV